MAIHYTCRCGANIRMPRNVAGKKARCNSCGYIFTVPLADPSPQADRLAGIPLEGGDEPESTPLPGPTVQIKPSQSTEEVGDWLGEFAAQESTAESVAPKPAPGSEADSGAATNNKPAPALLEFADKEDILAPVPSTPRRRLSETPTAIADEERSGVLGPTRSYWADLATSFFFFLDGPNLVTFIIIVLANLWTVPLSFAGAIGLAGLCFVSGYLCTFYMAVLKETAAGEDELPNVWIDDIYSDLIFSIFRFAGTWAWVLLPASIFALVEYVNFGQVEWNIVKLLGIIGLFFWPVVILGVALGGSFHGLWPHTIIITALVAPLPYLAMCAVLLIAAAITVLPHTDVYLSAISLVATKANRSLFWTVAMVNSGLSAYAMIVAMRAVGLYYRHYKRKFPWVAE
jgi:hypothetical protein